MADNIDITEGSGKTVSTDDIQVDGTHAQGQVQFVKLVDGTLNGTGSIRVNQAAKANALTIAPASDIADTTYIGDIKFGESLPAGTNNIGDVDVLSIAAGDNNIGNVDIVTVPAPLNVVGGGAEATALRVTLANDSTGVITVDGTVTANLSATDNTVLDNIDSNTDYGAVVGGGAEATALRVTIANDSTGVITVDGTVTANLSATDNAVLDNIDSDTTAIKDALEIMDDWDDGDYCNVNLNVAGTDVAANAGTLNAQTIRVTIATDDECNNLLGTIDADTSTIAGAVSGTEMQVDLVSTNRANAVEAITDWTAVAQNAVGESGTIDCSGHDATSLLIQAFLDTTTAHTGTEFMVQVSSNTTGNEDWHDYRPFTALVGTAATDLIEDDPLTSGSTSLTLTGHALTEEGIWIGIEDSTLANSELIYVASQSANAVVALDGTTNEHAQNTAVFNIAISKVIVLDSSVNRARVIVNNTEDADGSSLNYKVRATKLTR